MQTRHVHASASLRLLAAVAFLGSFAAAQEFTSGHLFLATSDGIIELAPDGSEVITLGLGGAVHDVEFSARGTLYASVPSDDTVYELNGDGSVIRILSDDALEQPAGLAIAPWGELLVTSLTSPDIVAFDTQGAFLHTFGTTPLTRGAGIEIGPDGHVLVCSSDDNQVIELDARGFFLGAFTDGVPNEPTAIVTTAFGTTLIGSSQAGGVRQVDHDGALLNESASFASPQALAFGPDRSLYVADGSLVTTLTASDSGFTNAAEFADITLESGAITGMAFAPQRFTARVRGRIVAPSGIIKVNEAVQVSLFPGDFHARIVPSEFGSLSIILTEFIGSGPDVPHPDSPNRQRVHSVMIGADAAATGIYGLSLELKGKPDAFDHFEIKSLKGTLRAFGGGATFEARVRAGGKKAKLN